MCTLLIQICSSGHCFIVLFCIIGSEDGILLQGNCQPRKWVKLQLKIVRSIFLPPVYMLSVIEVTSSTRGGQKEREINGLESRSGAVGLGECDNSCQKKISDLDCAIRYMADKLKG